MIGFGNVIERVDSNCVLNAAFFREIDFFFEGVDLNLKRDFAPTIRITREEISYGFPFLDRFKYNT